MRNVLAAIKSMMMKPMDWIDLPGDALGLRHLDRLAAMG